MGPCHPGSQSLSLVADDQQRLAALQLRWVDLPEPGEHVAPDALLEGGQVNRPQLRGGLPLFGEQDFQARRIDPGGVQSSGAQGGHDTVDDEGGGRGKQQHVVARIQRCDLARSRRHWFCYAGHGQGVSEDQAFKFEGVEKQVTDDGWGQGGRPSRDGIQCRNVEVGRHDAFHPAGDQVAEGREFDGVQGGTVGEDARQGQMGVEVGIAVSGKVLGACHHACGPQAFRPGETSDAHRLRV